MTVEYFLLFAGVIALTLFGVAMLPKDVRASLEDMFDGLAKVMSTPGEDAGDGGGEGCVPNCAAICSAKGAGWTLTTGACPGGTEGQDDECGGVCTCCCMLPGMCA